MILMTKSLLPTDVKSLKNLYREFHDLFNWKVVSKVEELNKYKIMQSAANRKLAASS